MCPPSPGWKLQASDGYVLLLGLLLGLLAASVESAAAPIPPSHRAVCQLQQRQYVSLMALKAAWRISSWGWGLPPDQQPGAASCLSGAGESSPLPIPSYCQWSGVDCAGSVNCFAGTKANLTNNFTPKDYFTPCYDGCVTALRLWNASLVGTIPSDAAIWLPFNVTLKVLRLDGTNLPSDLSLVGSIPTTLSLLSNLQTLTLSKNCESGGPREVCTYTLYRVCPVGCAWLCVCVCVCVCVCSGVRVWAHATLEPSGCRVHVR